MKQSAPPRIPVVLPRKEKKLHFQNRRRISLSKKATHQLFEFKNLRKSPSLLIEGHSTRPVVSSDEIQLRIDPIHGDWDDEQMAVMKAQAAVKNNLRKLNKVIIKNGGNHIGHVSRKRKKILDPIEYRLQTNKPDRRSLDFLTELP
ncbi:hypothetical protein SADUNF_Sadunf02G0085500 [Salix dunnii]|uniref:Uncharacterized protein n=1 Tax=Salix dunnii TaxID=1413687 RepID=A0A835TG68_9ROSI|nr:hypothetical protein SADUNF_Sadunf02G0085500 [Salix dunnii]